MNSFVRGIRGSYNKLEAFEGTLEGLDTIQLVNASRKLDITNDSASADFKFRFDESVAYSTLKPGETVSLLFNTRQIFISSTGADYRIWSYR